MMKKSGNSAETQFSKKTADLVYLIWVLENVEEIFLDSLNPKHTVTNTR